MDRPLRRSVRPFTPARERPEALAERTVGRDRVLGALHRRFLAAATSRNRCHSLIVGPRGSGKTHLLDVALHRLRADPQLAGRLVVSRIDEDVVGIVTYADLMLHIADGLGPASAEVDRARATRDVATVESAIAAGLEGRTLVVVVENLSRVFEHIGLPGQRSFRSFVETSGDVMVLASAPLLFKGIASRSEPWFGSFAIEHLPDLSLDEGIELLRRLAVEDGDEAFARFVLEPRGRARLAALHHLAGGSPRLWMVLAGCASVELLDDLVPAVEGLLENLVAYYQQRLWELAGNEQKLVRELGTGPASATVAELAARCGLDERTAATALGRLADSGWVRSEKVPGTDQRKTWYRLREPMLRHHFQYRQADGEPLRLIIDILRLWYDPTERRAHLAGVRPTSVAERHLLATLPLDPPQRSDAAYAGRDVERLLGEVRCWIRDPGTIGSPAAGMLLEAAVVAVTAGSAASHAVLDSREAAPALRRRAEALASLVAASSPDEPVETRVGAVLDAAAASAPPADRAVLELVAATWNGSFAAPDRTASRLEALLGRRPPDRLTLTIRDEHAFWVGHAGRHDQAVTELAAVAQDRIRLLGPDHPDTLSTRRSLGDQLGGAGRHDEAITALAAVVEDRARVLGPDHPDTLATRRSLAFQLGAAGRHAEAVTALSAVLDDGIRLLGPDSALVRSAGHLLTEQLILADRHDEAIQLAAAAVDRAFTRHGPEHERLWRAVEELFAPLLDLLRTGRPIPAVAEVVISPVGRRVLEVVGEMEAARDGAAEVGARLPSELRALVDQLRSEGQDATLAAGSSGS